LIGQTISHYRVTRQLGMGSMGIVYQAEDIKLKRMVALKFLSPGSTIDPNTKKRFIQEAQAASALDHPNICTIYEIDETPDGRLFIAMARYEGETLEERISRGPLELRAAVRIASQVAAGLASAHEQGIVHRDTKPANIFLTDDGQVKILDFGIAKLSGQASMTKANSIVGTVQYMSPEQANGEEVDGRTDIWSLGTVFYQMVTGRVPFPGENIGAVIHSILNVTPDPPTSIVPTLPPAIDGVLARCLEKPLGSRYQSMQDLDKDLQDLLNGLKPDDTATHKGAIPRSRRPLMMAGIVIAFIALAFGMQSVVTRLQQPSALDLLRIAVLPFENLGPSEDNPFCEGVTDVVTARLAGIAGLGVVSRQSAGRYRGSDQHVRDIGQELEVDYLLEGTVQRENPSDSSSRLRITPQLIRVADDTHVWAKTYDLDAESIFLVQTTIAERVAFELGITLLAPASRGAVTRIWTKDMYFEQAKQSLDAALLLNSQEPVNRTIVRSNFDMAIRSLIALGFLNPDHGNGDDLALAFTAIQPELNTSRTSPEIYRDYLDICLATDEPGPATGEFDLEDELGLIMAEFGVDATRVSLPPDLIVRVQEYVTMYTVKHRSFTETSLARSGEHLPMITRELRRRNLPEVLAVIPFCESGYDPDFESPVGAVGLWQLMPATSRDYGLLVEPDGTDQRRDPFLASVAAVEHLDFLLGVFGSNQFMCAVAAYNSGAGGLSRCIRSQGEWRSPWRFWDLVASDVSCLSQETKGYVPRFLAAAVIMRRPDAFEFSGLEEH
jgi:serine/threonine protein kinase